jgi:hypothetical protein
MSNYKQKPARDKIKNTNKYDIAMGLFISSIFLPYFGTIFFIRTASPIILFFIFFVALVVLIVSIVKARKSAFTRLKWKFLIPVAVSAVILFPLSYGLQLRIADILYFKLRENQLRDLALNIKSYNKIREMSDGQRFFKTINFISIEPNKKMLSAKDIGFERKYFLDDVLSKNGIDKQKYESFRQSLIETGFVSFTILQDGSISFTMDGMLDNCYGFSYSEGDKHPSSNDCGTIVRWVKLSDNWYAWATT